MFRANLHFQQCQKRLLDHLLIVRFSKGIDDIDGPHTAEQDERKLSYVRIDRV